jgi:hypothetical protein
VRGFLLHCHEAPSLRALWKIHRELKTELSDKKAGKKLFIFVFQDWSKGLVKVKRGTFRPVKIGRQSAG